MKKRLPMLPKKREAFQAILRFLTTSDVKLKVEEEAILNRWIYCDSLLRAKNKTEEQIINDIADKFSVSTFTARNDIGKTQELFAKSRHINKKYLIHFHLERIDRDIELIRSQFSGSDLDSKQIISLAKLYETYTYTLNSLPEQDITEKSPPPVFQFILAPGQIIENNMSLESAMQKADELLLKENDRGVYEAEPVETEEEEEE